MEGTWGLGRVKVEFRDGLPWLLRLIYRRSRRRVGFEIAEGSVQASFAGCGGFRV